MKEFVPRIKIPTTKIEEFCRKWKISELALFGSVLRDDFTPKSDIDILVTFFPQTQYSLFDMVDMEDELRSIFGREVDFIEKRAVEQSENYIRRKDILNSFQVLYAA